MSNRVNFSSNERPTATHYLQKCNGSVWWKVKGGWYRMFRDGSCGTTSGAESPDSHPGYFEPRSGDLVITVQKEI